MQRFPLVKVMIDGEVLDIQVMWNSKSNGFNATLWAPGFMVNDIGDVKEMVVKWLAIPVAVYLNSGSPLHGYSQSAVTFTKSKQGGIDVVAIFNHFCSHPTEKHALGVHVKETQPEGTYECHEFWHFCTLHYWWMPFPLSWVSMAASGSGTTQGD